MAAMRKPPAAWVKSRPLLRRRQGLNESVAAGMRQPVQPGITVRTNFPQSELTAPLDTARMALSMINLALTDGGEGTDEK